MKPGRVLPPVAAPVSMADIKNAFLGLACKKEYFREIRDGMREYFGVEFLFFVSSGKAAFSLILSALCRESERDEVVIPGYTCFSVPSVILKAGLKIRLCDLDPDTLDFDFDHMEKVTSERTLCIVPNHLFGIPSDMDRVRAIADRNGAYVVEDAAQAMGGTSHGKMLGTIGDAGFFSLGRGKNITSGNGGIVLTNSPRLAQTIEDMLQVSPETGTWESMSILVKVFLMKVFLSPHLYWIPHGLPFLRLGDTFFEPRFPCQGMGGVQAGFLKRWRENLEKSNRERKTVSGILLRRISRKKGEAGTGRNREPVYLRLPLMVPDKAMKRRLFSEMNARRVGISSMYPTSINRIPEIESLLKDQACPTAENIAEILFTLPTHSQVKEEDIDRICEILDGLEYSTVTIPAAKSG